MNDPGQHRLLSIPGDGVLARQGDLILLISLDDREFAESLLDLLSRTSEEGGDGRALADAISARIERHQSWGGPQATPAVVAFGPAGNGQAFTVSGTASADISTAFGATQLAPGHPSMLLRSVMGTPVQSVRAELGGDGPGDRTDRFTRLDSGTVRASGLSYQGSGSTSAGEPGPARSAPAPRVADRAPSAPARPAPAPSASAAPAAAPAPGGGGRTAPLPNRQAPSAPPPGRPTGPVPAGPSFQPSFQPRPRDPVGPPSGAGSFADEHTPPGEFTPPPAQYTPSSGEYTSPPARYQPASGDYTPPPADYTPPPGGWDSPAEPGTGPEVLHDLGLQEPGLGGPVAAPATSLAVPAGLAMEPPAAPGPAAPEPWESDGTPVVLGINCKNGHFTDPDARSCVVCGTGVKKRSAVPQRGPRPPLGVLILDDGATLPLDGDYVIGRDPTKDPSVLEGQARQLRVVDADSTVSRIHARIHLDGWKVLLTDLGSANGTRVQTGGAKTEQYLEPQAPMALQPGTHIFVGTPCLRFERLQ